MKTLKVVSTAVLLGFAGVALAATGLTVGVSAPASVPTGNAQTLATVTLIGGSQDAQVSMLPLSMGYAAQSGVITSAAPLTNCKINNAGGTTLNTGVNAVTSAVGSQDINVNFDQTLTVPANGTVLLSLVCDIPATVPNGSAVAVSIFPSTVVAKDVNGAVLAVAGTDPNGTSATPSAVTVIASATPGTGLDTGNGGTTGGSTTTPGTPNTGAGGDAATTLFVLALSGLVAVAAGAYTLRARNA